MMKKVLLIFILALLLPSCNRDHGGDSDTSFRAKPNTLTKFGSPGTGGTVNGTTYNYAIIFNTTINGINYVGFAVSNNPDPEATENFNLKIYFQSDIIPTTPKTITSDADATIVVYSSGTTYRGITSGSMTLNFGTPTTTGSYTTYPITSSGGPIDIGGFTINLNGIIINALKTL